MTARLPYEPGKVGLGAWQLGADWGEVGEDDAPDPAGDQWSLEDYQRETGQDEPAVAEPTEEPRPGGDIEAAPAGEERELDPVDEEGQ